MEVDNNNSINNSNDNTSGINNNSDNSSSNNNNNNSDSDNNSISDNDSGSGNSLEESFYKVIHNKYLFNQIIQQIHNSEWVIYDDLNDDVYDDLNDLNQIKYNNRIKFKDIVSVRWMIDKYQIELLKCKLDAGDPLQFDIPLYELLYEIQDEDDRESIFRLVLESTSIFNKDQLIYDSLHFLELEELINIAVNPPYSIPILTSTIERAFKESTPDQIIPILSTLFFKIVNNSGVNDDDDNNNNNNNNNNNSINSSSSSNKRKRDQFEFDNSSSDYKRSVINNYLKYIFKMVFNIQDTFKRDKVLENIFQVIELYNINSISTHPIDDLVNPIPTLDLVDIVYNIISTFNQRQLIKLKLYSIPIHLQKYKYEIEQIRRDIDNDSTLDWGPAFIQLENIIKESSTTTTTTSTFKYIKFSPELLLDMDNLYHFVNYSQTGNNNNNSILLNQLQRIDYKSKTELPMRYIKYYLNLNFRIKFIDDCIDSTLKNNIINGRRLVEELPNSNSESKWVQLYRMVEFKNGDYRSAYITDIDTIQFIFKNFTNDEINYEKFKFSTYELLHYAISQSDHIKTIIENHPILYSYAIQNLMELGNYNKVIEIYNSINKDRRSSIRWVLSDAISSCNGKNSIGIDVGYSIKLKLMESFILNMKWSYGVYSCLDLFIDKDSGQMSKFIYDTSYLLGQDYERLRCKLTIHAIITSKPKVLDLLFTNNINPILSDTTLFNQIWNSKVMAIEMRENPLLGFHDGEIRVFIYVGSQNIDDGLRIKSCIMVLLKHMDNEMHQMLKLASNTSTEQQSIIIGRRELYEKTINYLFYCLINNCKSNQIIHETYQLINKSLSVKVYRNSTLFSIYYLSIKSNLYIKYIASSPLFKDIFKAFIEDDHFYYSIPSTNVTELQVPDEDLDVLELFDIRTLLDPSIFSYDYIFNNNISQDTILDELINQLSYKPIKDNQSHIEQFSNIEFQIKMLKYNLEFCLDIRRVDLFYKHLDIIKNQFNGQFNSNQFKFSDRLIKMIKYYGLDQIVLDYPSKIPSWSNKDYSKESKYVNELIDAKENIFRSTTTTTTISIEKKSSCDDIEDSLINQLESSAQEYIGISSILSFNCYRYYLSKYPSHQLFKPSKRLIFNAVESRSWLFIKYLLDNQLIDNDNSNQDDQFNQLKSYLNQQLLNNNQFKFWYLNNNIE